MIPDTSAAIRRVIALEAENERLRSLLQRTKPFLSHLAIFAVHQDAAREARILLSQITAAYLDTNAAGDPVPGREAP